MSTIQEQVLKISMQCVECGTVWQFENTEAVAEKSIDHHYKSGECKQNKERNTRSVGAYKNTATSSFPCWSATGTSTTSYSPPTWTNPPRGQWYYL